SSWPSTIFPTSATTSSRVILFILLAYTIVGRSATPTPPLRGVLPPLDHRRHTHSAPPGNHHSTKFRHQRQHTLNASGLFRDREDRVMLESLPRPYLGIVPDVILRTPHATHLMLL